MCLLPNYYLPIDIEPLSAQVFLVLGDRPFNSYRGKLKVISLVYLKGMS
jgi:hypothetical protein